MTAVTRQRIEHTAGFLWARVWMKLAWVWPVGWLATWCATWFIPPDRGRSCLAWLNRKGYVSLRAIIHAPTMRLGSNIFIGDRNILYQDVDGGPIELGNGVHLYGDSYFHTGQGGSIQIGDNSHIQPRCQLTAYLAPIRIGRGVSIAPACAFFPYDHGTAADKLIASQPLETKGGIIVEDDAWLGYGVTVLNGVRIGKGAVVGAGSVVTRNVPDGAIAAGAPAKVIKLRSMPMQPMNRVSAGREQ